METPHFDAQPQTFLFHVSFVKLIGGKPFRSAALSRAHSQYNIHSTKTKVTFFWEKPSYISNYDSYIINMYYSHPKFIMNKKPETGRVFICKNSSKQGSQKFARQNKQTGNGKSAALCARFQIDFFS